MKTIITLITIVLTITTIFLPKLVLAQTSDNMNYQAVIRDIDGNLMANHEIGMQISIFQGAVGDSPIYVERHYPITNANGLVTLVIGYGNVIVGDYYSIDWANLPFFLRTETDLDGGDNYTILGDSPLYSVSYALHAKTADSIVNGVAEYDPVFSESLAFGITETDTANWNNKLDTEVDGDITNELQLIDVIGNTIYLTDGGSADLPPETDPIFDTSVAGGITAADTAAWNAGGGAETDPVFGASIASGITATDTAYWFAHADSTDVAFWGFVAGPHTDSAAIANMGYIAFLGLSQNAAGQITISDNGGTAPDPSALLDLQSTTRGFLLPRMTFVEMKAIPNPPAGMQVIESATGSIFVYTLYNDWVAIINDAILDIDRLADAASNSGLNSYYIGEGAGTGHSQSASFTTAVGNDAGIGYGEGDFNTALGAGSGPATGTTDLNHTTIIGYNAKAEASHQVVLGTINDTVIIPNTIRIKTQLDPPVGTVGKLYVETADSNLYYHNGNDWQLLNDDYKVGDFAFGGVIYYVDESGKHGLVCNLLDPDPSIRWSSGATPGNITYAEGDGIYAGEMNTAIAVAALGWHGENSAIQVSANWRTSSPFATNYGDWYLPSREELLLMYTNKDAINATINAEGWGSAIGTGIYWSSTEYHDVGNQAYVVDFSDGTTDTPNKETLHRMRPIRKF